MRRRRFSERLLDPLSGIRLLLEVIFHPKQIRDFHRSGRSRRPEICRKFKSDSAGHTRPARLKAKIGLRKISDHLIGRRVKVELSSSVYHPRTQSATRKRSGPSDTRLELFRFQCMIFPFPFILFCKAILIAGPPSGLDQYAVRGTNKRPIRKCHVKMKCIFRGTGGRWKNVNNNASNI